MFLLTGILVLLSRESALSAATSKFPSSRNFFEMIRVDFVIDANLNVFIMEVSFIVVSFFIYCEYFILSSFCIKANMSPNLSSQHFPLNRLLYEQVIFNLLKLVGVIPIENFRLVKK